MSKILSQLKKTGWLGRYRNISTQPIILNAFRSDSCEWGMGTTCMVD